MIWRSSKWSSNFNIRAVTRRTFCKIVAIKCNLYREITLQTKSNKNTNKTNWQIQRDKTRSSPSQHKWGHHPNSSRASIRVAWTPRCTQRRSALLKKSGYRTLTKIWSSKLENRGGIRALAKLTSWGQISRRVERVTTRSSIWACIFLSKTTVRYSESKVRSKKGKFRMSTILLIHSSK